jgi:hypothetical protein
LGFVVLSAVGLGLAYYFDQREMMAGEEADAESVVVGNNEGSGESTLTCSENVSKQVDLKASSQPDASSAGLSWMTKAGIVVGLFGASLLSTLVCRVILLVSPAPSHILQDRRADFWSVLISVLFGQAIFGFLANLVLRIAAEIKFSMRRFRSKALVTAAKIVTVFLHVVYVLAGLLCAPFLMIMCAVFGVQNMFSEGKEYLFDYWTETYVFEIEDESVE